MKTIHLFIFMLISVLSCFAQTNQKRTESLSTYTVKGTVIDSISNQSVQYATLSIAMSRSPLSPIKVIVSDNNVPLKVVGVIDDDKEKQGRVMVNVPIISKDELKKYNHDAIVVSSYVHREKIINSLKGIGYNSEKIVKFFEKIIPAQEKILDNLPPPCYLIA